MDIVVLMYSYISSFLSLLTYFFTVNLFANKLANSADF